MALLVHEPHIETQNIPESIPQPPPKLQTHPTALHGDTNTSDETSISNMTSNLHQVAMNKSYASRIKKEASHYRNIMKYLNNGRYLGTDEGKRIYGALMAFSPQTSFESMELIINLAHAAFLRDTGIADNISQLGCYTPSASTLQQLIHECATDSMYEARKEIL